MEISNRIDSWNELVELVNMLIATHSFPKFGVRTDQFRHFENSKHCKRPLSMCRASHMAADGKQNRFLNFKNRFSSIVCSESCADQRERESKRIKMGSSNVSKLALTSAYHLSD